MQKLILAAIVLLSSSTMYWADEDITNRIQEMNKFSDQERARQQEEQYKQYLRNNDADHGVSQRTGPTGSIIKGGGTAGYQWSTK